MMNCKSLTKFQRVRYESWIRPFSPKNRTWCGRIMGSYLKNFRCTSLSKFQVEAPSQPLEFVLYTCAYKHNIVSSTHQGRIQDFHWGRGGGGAQKIMCVHGHHESEAQSSLLPGGGGWKLLGVLMLSNAIWALFLSILIQNGIKKQNMVGKIWGRARACCAPSKSATAHSITVCFMEMQSFEFRIEVMRRIRKKRPNRWSYPSQSNTEMKALG